MIGWGEVYRRELRPVRKEWARLVTVIHQGRSSELDRVCPDFRDRVSRMDHRALAEAPDPVVRIWLGRGLNLLNGAASQCRRDRFFALLFRLDRAGEVIRLIDRRVARYFQSEGNPGSDGW